jgi:DNA-binding NtrC family response regulator
MTRVNMFDGGIEAGQPVKVLVVEDEALIGAMVSDALLDRGFDVQVVASADDAMRFLNSGLRIDVLFTDINMPGDMDGVALACEMRRTHPHLHLILTSGHWTHAGDQVPDGAVFLQKPYSLDAVVQLVKQLVKRS